VNNPTRTSDGCRNVRLTIRVRDERRVVQCERLGSSGGKDGPLTHAPTVAQADGRRLDARQ
jgi:hypothetical protein